MTSRPPVHVFADPEKLAAAAAERVATVVVDALKVRPMAALALSGGSTPRRTYELLSTRLSDGVDLANVHWFWADERCVPPEHEDSNFKMAYDALLQPLQIADRNIHRIRGDQGQEHAATEYGHDIHACFGLHAGGYPQFDAIVLGLGEDGHTASLFPQADELWSGDLVVKTIGPQWPRVSLSLPVLNAARNVLFIVKGRGKSDVLSRALEEPDSGTPASLIRPAGTLEWFVDSEAAARL
jgi:6-phosphogluconolactonase